MLAVPGNPSGIEATTLWELVIELVLASNGSLITLILCHVPLSSEY